MLQHWMARWRTHSPRRGAWRSVSPRLEALEDRNLPSLFAPPVNFTAGGLAPRNPVVGDFTGAGHLDLAVLNDSGLAVFLNNGDGTFKAPVTYNAGALPNSIAVADLNGDGKPDLVVADAGTIYGGGSVNVLLNNGDGTFAAPVKYPTGTTPFALAIGDFNGDGKVDIAVADSAAGNAFVLLNKGNGTFQNPSPVNVGSPSDSIAVGDFNGDNHLDFAVAHFASGKVSVVLGNGDGTFKPAVDYAAGGNTGSVVSGDFNGDGHLDLAVVDFNSAGAGSVSVLLGNGDGTFKAPNPFPIGFNPSSMVAGDFNNDGHLDLAVVPTNTSNSNNVNVLLGNGDGTFQPFIAFATNMGPTGVAVGDLNGDGAPDLAVTNGKSNDVSLLLNTGGTTTTLTSSFNPAPVGQAVTFTAVVAPVIPGSGTPTGMVTFMDGAKILATAALDATGKATFTATLSAGAHSLSAFYTGVSPFFSSASPVLKQTNGNLTATVGMFDPSTGIWYLRNQNNAGPPNIAPFAYGAPGWQAVVGDWNGDTIATIGVVDPTTGTWYLRNENSAGAPDVATPFLYGLPGWIPVVGDWTGTGHTGIGTFDPTTATWYLRNSPSPGAADFVFQYGGPGWLPVTGDWDGNGTTTIGVVNPSTFTWYLRNENSGGAPDAAAFTYGAPGWKPLAGNFSGSGRTTIAVVDPNGNWYIRNSLSGGAPDITPFPYGLGGWTPLAGHYANTAGPRSIPTARGAPGLADAVLVNDLLGTKGHGDSSIV